VKLEESLLILAVEETETRFAPPEPTGLPRISGEFVRIAGEAAIGIVDDIEESGVGAALRGVRLLQRRTKRARAGGHLIGSAQAKPNR
jgi:hypothetical protein